MQSGQNPQRGLRDGYLGYSPPPLPPRGLQAYDYTVVYRPGKTNIANSLSRLNGAKKDGSSDYDFIRSVIEYTVPIALTPREVEEASVDDPELREIRDCVRNQN